MKISLYLHVSPQFLAMIPVFYMVYNIHNPLLHIILSGFFFKTMRAKKIGCGSPTCFLKTSSPTWSPPKPSPSPHNKSTSPYVSSGHPTFLLQNSDPVFQQGPPAPICVPWFPSFFFISVTGWSGGRYTLLWVVLSGRGCGEKSPCSFRRWMDSVCVLFGWLVVLGEMKKLLAFLCAKIFWRLIDFSRRIFGWG